MDGLSWPQRSTVTTAHIIVTEPDSMVDVHESAIDGSGEPDIDDGDPAAELPSDEETGGSKQLLYLPLLPH